MTRSRILVVDDEPGMLHAVRRLLERNYELALCSTAEQALQVAASFEPELAILDVRLPGADGFELMRRLRRQVLGLDVILMTGSLTDIDGKMVRSLREEAFFFLQKPFDREVLLTLVERWQERRRLTRLNADYVARLEEELRQARAFQRRMLPGETAQIGGLSLRGRYLPCESLGGDFYDWADAGSGRVAALIADVAGHGVAAAMLTGFVKAAFHAAHVDAYAPVSVAERVRDGLRGLDDASFVTLCAVRIDARDGSLQVSSCGHPYAAVLRGAECEPLDSTGPLLSPAFSDVDCGLLERAWHPGDRLVLWTDGIEEAADVHGELFGRTRLETVLRAAREQPIAAVEAAVNGFIAQRPLRDDCTLVTID